jgi:hypothetical protein
MFMIHQQSPAEIQSMIRELKQERSSLRLDGPAPSEVGLGLSVEGSDAEGTGT